MSLAAVLLWHYGVRWRTLTGGLRGPKSGAPSRRQVSPETVDFIALPGRLGRKLDKWHVIC